MKGISTQQFKTALIIIDNALKEIENGIITLSENDADPKERIEEFIECQKTLLEIRKKLNQI